MDETSRRILWLLTALDLFLYAVLFVLLSLSLFGGWPILDTISQDVQVAVWLVAGLQLLIPVGIYVDVKRRGDDGLLIWVNATVLPVVGVFGLAGYLLERYRTRAD